MMCLATQNWFFQQCRKFVLLPTTPYFSWTSTPRRIVMGANNRASTTLVRMEGKENRTPLARLAPWMAVEVFDHSKLIFFQQRGKYVLLPTTPYFSWTRASRRVVMGANERASSTVVRMECKENRSPIAWLTQWMAIEVSDHTKLIFSQQCGKFVLHPTTVYFSWTRAPRRVIMDANDRAWSTLVIMELEVNRSSIARLAQWMVYGVSAHPENFGVNFPVTLWG